MLELFFDWILKIGDLNESFEEDLRTTVLVPKMIYCVISNAEKFDIQKRHCLVAYDYKAFALINNVRKLNTLY